jgi:hypothetical protein
VVIFFGCISADELFECLLEVVHVFFFVIFHFLESRADFGIMPGLLETGAIPSPRLSGML